METTVKIVSIPADTILKELAELRNELIKLTELQTALSARTPELSAKPERLVGLKEAANRLAVSNNTLISQIKNGAIPIAFHSISDTNRKLYCREKKLNEFIAKNWTV